MKRKTKEEHVKEKHTTNDKQKEHEHKQTGERRKVERTTKRKYISKKTKRTNHTRDPQHTCVDEAFVGK